MSSSGSGAKRPELTEQLAARTSELESSQGHGAEISNKLDTTVQTLSTVRSELARTQQKLGLSKQECGKLSQARGCAGRAGENTPSIGRGDEGQRVGPSRCTAPGYSLTNFSSHYRCAHRVLIFRLWI